MVIEATARGCRLLDRSENQQRQLQHIDIGPLLILPAFEFRLLESSLRVVCPLSPIQSPVPLRVSLPTTVTPCLNFEHRYQKP